jgi:hypothetical protein
MYITKSDLEQKYGYMDTKGDWRKLKKRLEGNIQSLETSGVKWAVTKTKEEIALIEKILAGKEQV